MPLEWVVLIHIKFYPQYDPPHPCCWLKTPAWQLTSTLVTAAMFSLEQLATAFCYGPSPSLLSVKWGDQALLDTRKTDVTYSILGTKNLQNVKRPGIIHVTAFPNHHDLLVFAPESLDCSNWLRMLTIRKHVCSIRYLSQREAHSCAIRMSLQTVPRSGHCTLKSTGHRGQNIHQTHQLYQGAERSQGTNLKDDSHDCCLCCRFLFVFL